MPGKIARSPPRPPFGLAEVHVMGPVEPSKPRASGESRTTA